MDDDSIRASGAEPDMRKKACLLSAALVATTLAAGCVRVASEARIHPASGMTPLSCSMISLIANPEKYDGRVVRIIGFVSFEHESDGIYLSKSDYDLRRSENGLWMERTGELFEEGAAAGRLNHRYVLVEGTFLASDKGHMDMFGGSISSISRMEPWPDALRSMPPSPPQ